MTYVLLIDETITKEEEGILIEHQTNEIKVVRISKKDITPILDIFDKLNRFNTMLLSRDNIGCLENSNGEECLVTLIQITDHIIWNVDDSDVATKTKSVYDFVKGEIYTLFAEKLAFTNDLELSQSYSSYIKGNECVFDTSEPGLVFRNLDIYSLGRYYGSEHRKDNMSFLCAKLKLKFRDSKLQQEILINFLSDCFDYFISIYDKNFYFKGYVPTHKERFNRFVKITPYNIIKLNHDYQSLKEKSELSREERVKDAFAVEDYVNVKGKSVLIFDDIITTGSTTNEIAKILYENGASDVTILTVAKTYRNDYSLDVVCHYCKEPFKIEFRNSDGNPFIKCKNKECSNTEVFHNDNSFFTIYNFIFRVNNNFFK